MQLDRTQIAIRERGLWELLDLSLRVIARCYKPLLFYTALGVLPFFLFNLWATNWMVADELSTETMSRQVFVMAQLVFLEAPLATLLTTIFLGRFMFLQPVDYRSLLAELWKYIPRIVWTQLVVRGGFLVFLLAATVSSDVEISQAEILLPVFCLVSALFRATRPFVNEIILLEKNPIRSNNPATITVRRRSSALHRPSQSDLIPHWLVFAAMGILLTLCLSAGFWFCSGAISNQWRWGSLMVELLIPLSMWLVAMFMAVVRFLNYLDLRIRREGWEVELKVRAAANELKGAV
ncbi:MAG: hypothetical protein P8N76_22130 [Pirellulaceae bacterium]|nr:hypothetical protein [Pirellulaceae bacterium]